MMKFPDFPSAMRAVPHNEELPVPMPSKKSDF